MNLKSEQINSDGSLDIAYDQPLIPSKIKKVILSNLGNESHVIEIKVDNYKKKVIYYKNKNNKEYLILPAAVTYLGGKHKIYKKRIQLKPWYKKVVELFPNYEVIFLGVYHYNNNIIFVDFIKDSYMMGKFNNSSAHVYTNDLYQTIKLNQFLKKDQRGNISISISEKNLITYLNDESYETDNELEEIVRFNKSFPFNKEITLEKAVPEMYLAKWPHWKQGEWPGFYLEYLFYNYTVNSVNINYLDKSIGKTKDSQLDFDVYFPRKGFYGDLKASNIEKNEAPGNDKESLRSAIDKGEKFWYLMYEHETVKDKDLDGYPATVFWNNFKLKNNGWKKGKKFDEFSYKTRLKSSVTFKKMSILEINKVNFSHALFDFHQGKQPDGSNRKVKVSIRKKDINNFLIYTYER